MINVGEKGKLRLYTRQLLGKGSIGHVFKGRYIWKQAVAVKRIRITKGEQNRILKIRTEVHVLERLVHENVIRYWISDSDDRYIYIAMDLCDGTLWDFNVQSTDNYKRVDIRKKLLNDIALGLNYIHGKDIVHGDLTPQNVLLKTGPSSSKDLSFRAVISDYGLSLKHEEGLTVTRVTKQSPQKARGWKPKELLTEEKVNPTKPADVFAFGCLVHFTLASNRGDKCIHPFGFPNFREENIRNDNRLYYLYSIKKKAHPLDDYLLADILIDLCVSTLPSEQLTTQEILDHPLFWSPDKKIKFTTTIVKLFNAKRLKFDNVPRLNELEENWKNLNLDTSNFIGRFLPRLWELCDNKPKDKSADTLFFFMRLLRNITQHYADYEETMEEFLGDGDTSTFVQYLFGGVPPAFPTIYLSFYPHCSPYTSLKEFFRENMSSSKIEKSWDTMKKFTF